MRHAWIVALGVTALLAGLSIQQGLPKHSAWNGPDPVMVDSYGESRRFSDYGEQRLVLNFWASECSPCIEEMPKLSALHERMGHLDVAVLGIAVDEPEAVAEFIKRHPVSYPILQGHPAAEQLLDQFGNADGVLPFTVVLDAGGKVLYRHAGPIDFSELETQLSDKIR